ncbi:dual specificity protein phosphatase 2-like [Amia ocellicauda]|uniref:dual specificity protein phosphatase 2-like n=1 Tax=Amia ocellicauda TaxID=2972642 RepID=UPI003463F312
MDFKGFFSLWPQLCVKSPGLCGNRDPETVWTEETPPLYEQDGPVEPLPFLFLGSARDASQWEGLAGRGITAVLNVSSRCPNVFEGRLDYRTLRLEDSLATDLTPTLPHAIRFIDSVRERGGRVLVHCQAGVSRSAAVCLAYLMESRRLPLAEALAFVRQRRAAVAPNLAFMGQLLQLETQGLCH